jgi:hypothetical protein
MNHNRISAAHVSATLAKAGHPRASEPSGQVSGFVVQVGEVTQDDIPLVTVGYQDYDHPGYSNATREVVGRVCEAAFDSYAATLRRAGYVTEDWRNSWERLGLFVTGKS